jgi:hypothetical protein
MMQEQRDDLEWIYRSLEDTGFPDDIKKELARDLARKLPSRSQPITDDEFEEWWREKATYVLRCAFFATT